MKEFSEKNLDPKFKNIDDRFEKIDNQFAKIDSRFEQGESRFTEFKEDFIHQSHIISEDVISKVQWVAEGVATLNEKLDRHIDENNKQFKETREEILAAVKFSYAELDRRISTLGG